MVKLLDVILLLAISNVPICAVPAVTRLAPVMLPEALTTPVTYSPEPANTATLPVPPTPTATLPPDVTTVTFDVPLLMLATDVITPVSNAPLPRM